MPRRKRKEPFLKRPNPVMLRFSDDELKDLNTKAKAAGLSRVEYARRKILGLAIINLKASGYGVPAETGVA